MRVKFRKSALEKALAILAGCVQSNSNKEVLRCVLVKVEPDSVTIEATNLDIFARTTVKDADIDHPGKVLIDAAKLRKIVADAGDEINIETDSNNILYISSGKFKTNCPTMSADEFPAMVTLEEPTRFSIKSKDLVASIPKVVKSIDEDSVRFALGGVGFDIDGEKLNMVGTDGRRLSHVCCDIANFVQAKSDGSTAVVPPECLRVLLKAASDEVVDVELGFNSITFTCGGNKVNSRLVEGRYPNWRQVIPLKDRSDSGVSDLEVTIPANDLIVALRQVSITADAESRGVDFLFCKDKLLITASAVDSGESESEVAVETNDDRAVKMKLDIDYMRECAMSVASESFKLYVLNSKSPVVARQDNFTYVLMPMSLDK